MGRLLLIAARNLRQNRRRTALLSAAVVAVTMLLVLLGSLGNGIQATLLEAGTAMITGHVNVGGFFKITSGMGSPVVVDAARTLADVKELAPEASRIVQRRRGFGKVVSESDTIQCALTGIDATNDEALRGILRIREGSLDNLDADGHSILLFEKQAERLNVSVGDDVTLSSQVVRGQTNAIQVRVGAIARDMGLLSIMSSYVSLDVIRDLYQLDPDTTGVILVYLDDPEQAGDVKARLREGLLARNHRLMEDEPDAFYHKFQQVAGEDWTGMKLDVTTWEDELANIQWTMKTFDTISSLLIGVLLVIVVIGVMNTMWITVRDRTREIGTLRAIGMGRFRVLVMFLLETVILSVLSALAGVLLGAGIAELLNSLRIPVSQGFQIFLMSDTLRLVVSPRSLLLAVVVVPLLTTFGALIPASRAARLRPVTAMQHAG
ncbi:MAG: ABC transporter permease [Deltaproteobacteria bacterium]|nr:ABC transporter permease [Deltaproteobacteria bacterium]